MESSWIQWPIIGAAQLGVGVVFAIAVAWYVTLFVSGGAVPVSTVELAEKIDWPARSATHTR